MTGSVGQVPGAVDVAALDERHPDAGVAAHYGDPTREQRVLASEVGLVDRSHRGVVAVTGDDRRSWLHNLTSQHLMAIAPMTGTELLVLSPHGHVEEHAGVLDDGATTWLDVEPGRQGPLLGFLTSMVFLLRVAPEDVTKDLAVLSLVGPSADQALAALGAEPLPPPDVLAVPPPKFPTGALGARPSSRYPAAPLPSFDALARRVPSGVDLLVPRAAVMDVVRAAGAPLAGVWAYEALRVAARRPRFGFETDHRTLPAEVEWYAALHLEKGCYRGQETVSRIHHLGRPPRRLALLHLDGIVDDQPPARHTPILVEDGHQVGFVGTGVRHHEFGLIASAILGRSVPDDAVLRVGGATAAIEPEPRSGR